MMSKFCFGSDAADVRPVRTLFDLVVHEALKIRMGMTSVAAF
jgi:hypothetical protein